MDNSERMRDIIREKKLKQEDVARLTKTKQQTVSGWLRSKYINPRAIEKFTRGLGMEVEDFYCTPEYLAKKIKLSPEAFAIAKAILISTLRFMILKTIYNVKIVLQAGAS